MQKFATSKIRFFETRNMIKYKYEINKTRGECNAKISSRNK